MISITIKSLLKWFNGRSNGTLCKYLSISCYLLSSLLIFDVLFKVITASVWIFLTKSALNPWTSGNLDNDSFKNLSRLPIIARNSLDLLMDTISSAFKAYDNSSIDFILLRIWLNSIL